MNEKMTNWMDLFVESINYILITYALSYMAMLFQHSVLFVLFFASEIWVMGNYWRKVYEITKNKVGSAILLIVCFLLQIGLVYFVGRAVGEIVPFRQ